jgi:hypothetical protein
MSQSFSRHLHPFDVAHHPTLEPEVKRAILTSWASDRHSVENDPAMRKPPKLKRPASVDDVFAALCALDGPESQPTLR